MHKIIGLLLNQCSMFFLFKFKFHSTNQYVHFSLTWYERITFFLLMDFLLFSINWKKKFFFHTFQKKKNSSVVYICFLMKYKSIAEDEIESKSFMANIVL